MAAQTYEVHNDQVQQQISEKSVFIAKSIFYYSTKLITETLY